MHGVPVDDRPPKILEELEKLNPAPAETVAEIRARQHAFIAERIGARPGPLR